MDILSKIEQNLAPEDVTWIKNEDGSEFPYLEINIAKKKLTSVFGFWGWSESSFSYGFLNVDGEPLIHGSIQITIKGEDGETKTLSGGATHSIKSFKESGITNYAGSIKSMAMTNAVRDIGRFFGSELYSKQGEENEKKQEDEIDQYYIDLKDCIIAISSYESAKSILENSKHPTDLSLQNIVNKKKPVK